MISPVLFRNTFVLFFIIISVNLNAQNGWTEPINLSNTPDNELWGYSLSIDANGVIYAVWSEKPFNTLPRKEIWLRKSTDYGITWSEHEVISDLGDYRFPQIAIDSKGDQHVVYWSNYHNSLFYITSANGWAVPMQISGPGTQNGEIIIDKKDNIYFFWIFWGDTAYVSCRSLSGGVLSDTTILSDLSFYGTSGRGGTTVLDDDNILHFIYLQIAESEYELLYRRKDDYGWSEPERITTDSLQIKYFQITLKDNRPFVVWSQGVSDTTGAMDHKIYWCKRTDHWSAPETVSDLSFSYNPNICTDKNDVVHLVFSNRTFSYSLDSIYYSIYRDGSWSDANIVEFNLRGPLLGALNTYNDNICLLFNASVNDVYFSSRSILLGIGEKQEKVLDETSLTIYPNPFNSETTIKYVLNTGGRAQITLFDILGKEIRPILNEDRTPGEYEFHFIGNGLASGVYLLKLRINDQNKTVKLLVLN